MNQTDYSLRSIELKLDRLIDWIASQENLQKEMKNEKDTSSQRYVTLGEACRMLNVYKLSTLRARPDLQPADPIKIGRQRCFTRESVEKWLNSYKKQGGKLNDC